MSWRLLLCAAVLVPSFGPSLAAADDEPLRVTLTPLVAPPGHEGPVRHQGWRRVLTIESRRAQEVVRDRRLLQIEVRPEGSRRRLRCAHPDAPRRVDEGRVASMASGERYVEWFDLRMLCTGRAREALERGDATLRVRYGFRSRSRRRWVARQENERRPPFRVETELSWSPPAANDASEADAESPVRVSLADQTSRGTPRFAARVRGSGRAYLRDDQWSFVISGPLGDAVCQVSRARIVPIVDFFSRLTRRGRRTTLDAGLYCPDESFSVAGVYEVTPRLELVHDGAQYELSAHTGTYTGEPAVFRVRRRSYVEQRVEDLFATPNERGDDDE